MIETGQLRERVTIQAPSVVRNGIGEPVPSWTDVATVWADVKDLSGREINAARVVQSESVRRVTIRWRGDITADMRVVRNGVVMVITAPPRMVGWKEFLELDCSEGLRDA